MMDTDYFPQLQDTISMLRKRDKKSDTQQKEQFEKLFKDKKNEIELLDVDEDKKMKMLLEWLNEYHSIVKKNKNT